MEASDPDFDAQLVALARAAASGGRTEAQQLFVRLLPRVRNLVRYLVRGDREVDDLSQEALVCVLRGLKTYRGEGSFRAWCDRVVARSVFSRRKQLWLVQGQERPLPDDGVIESGSPAPDTYALRRELAQRLDALPEVQRAALVLHHVLGLTVGEIAVELGSPEETIRSRLRLGLERLRSDWAAARQPAEDRMVG